MRATVPWWKRVGWMIAIWIASVSVMFMLGGVIRLILKP